MKDWREYYPPETVARYEAHYAKVRAGLHVPQDHVFSESVADQIATRKLRVSRLFEAIAHEERELAKLHREAAE